MKYIIVDTNILLDNLEDLLNLNNATLIIPFVALEELDDLKNSNNTKLAQKSRKVINSFIEISRLGNILKGVSYDEDNNLNIRVVHHDKNISDKNDTKILDVVDKVAYQHKNTYFCTNDLSLRLKAIALGFSIFELEAKKNKSTKEIEQLCISTEFIDSLYRKKFIVNTFGEFKPNSYINIRNANGTSQSALVRYSRQDNRFYLLQNKKVFNIQAKGSEQICALDSLLDPNVPAVILTGESGVGKTFLALAAGLEQVIEKQRYGKVLLSRPNVSIGNDLGFLPGTKNEKLCNWFGGFKDNIQQLTGEERKFDYLLGTGLIELEGLAYLRGRSLYDSFIIIDEVQNCSKEQIKTILTRVGNKSKIVLMGDVTQIDSRYLTEESNGLSYLIKKAKDTDLVTHVHLRNSEIRSRLTAWAVENL